MRFQLGPLTTHLVVHPDHVRYVLVERRKNFIKGRTYDMLRPLLGNGLVTAQGELWRKQRRLMQPLFTPTRVRHFAERMVALTVEHAQDWRTLAESDGPPHPVIDVGEEMARLTLRIITATMFGVDRGETVRVTNDAFSYVMDFITKRSSSPLSLPIWMPTPAHRRFRASIERIDAVIDEIVDTRRDATDDRQDLITLLQNAEDEDSGERMELRQLRDEVVTTYFAGHETTARTLTWAWYMLSVHPDVEVRLHEELDRVLDDRSPTLDDIPRLPYTRALIDETLRLFGPVFMFARDVVETDEIGGYPVPAGSLVFVSPYITHRHPDFWSNPERFEPDRFLLDGQRDRHRFSYYPFGTGERVCIGSHFALQESVLLLATLARNCRLSLAPGSFVEVSGISMLRPKFPIRMTLHRR